MIFRFKDTHNTGRLIPRITEFSTSGSELILKMETEHDCKVEFLQYKDKAAMRKDLDDVENAIKEYYVDHDKKEPMGYSTDAVGYEEEYQEDDDDDDYEDRKIGFVTC